MSRNNKFTVEYFPHFCSQGRTKAILQRKFGNDGYSVFFKTLEMLGSSEGHFYNCDDILLWEYLIARVEVEDKRVEEIYKLLVRLGQFDKGLWENGRVIWCQNFVDNLNPIYTKRIRPIPKKPTVEEAHKMIEVPRVSFQDDEKSFVADLSFEDAENVKKVDKAVIEAFVLKWNEVATKLGLSRIEKISKSRLESLTARLKESTFTDDIFKAIEEQNFLYGHNDRKWRISFDWIIKNDTNYIKVIERKYSDGKNIKGSKEFNIGDSV